MRGQAACSGLALYVLHEILEHVGLAGQFAHGRADPGLATVIVAAAAVGQAYPACSGNALWKREAFSTRPAPARRAFCRGAGPPGP